MKKIFFSILIIGLLFSLGCDKPAEEELFLAAGLSVSCDGATELDEQVTFNFTVENPEATEITVTGSYETSVSISGGEGSFTASIADLSLAAAGDEASFTFTANSEGNPEYSFSVAMAHPMTVAAPEGVVQNAVESYLSFGVSTVSATVSAVTLQTKVGADGTYADVTGTFDVASDSIAVTGEDYNLSDTVYYKVTATAGALSSSVETYFVVGQWTFANESEAITLDATNAAFDVTTGEFVAADVDTADFILALGGSHIGLTANATNEALFIVDTDGFFDNPDIPLFNIFVGDWTTGVATIANFEIGDVYLFKTVRAGTEEIVGVLKITAINRNITTPALSSVTFKYLSGK